MKRVLLTSITLMFILFPGITPALNSTAVADKTAVATAATNTDFTKGWTKTWGGASNDSPRRVATDPLGNIFVVGEYTGTVDFNPDPAKTEIHISTNGTIDAFAAKYAPDGKF